MICGVAGKNSEAATRRSWVEHPDAMFAQAWFEAVGTKPEEISMAIKRQEDA
jgi:hypothetical protein